MGKRPAPGQEHCSAPLDDPELTRVVTEALDAAEIPYEVKRQSLTVGSDGQLHERATLLFDANDFDRVREVMDAKLEEVKAAERAEGRDLGKATISLQNDEQTQAVTAALEAEGIPYKVERTTLGQEGGRRGPRDGHIPRDGVRPRARHRRGGPPEEARARAGRGARRP